MINRITKTVTEEVREFVSVTCDRCYREFSDPMDLQEFHQVNFTGGYSSVFGDMTKVTCDLCQTCLKTLIGDFCAIDGEYKERPY